MKKFIFAILCVFAFAAPLWAQVPSYGNWVSLGDNVSARIFGPLMDGDDTWEFRNDGSVAITYMDFYYTDKTGTHYDTLPVTLNPGQIFGGWASFTCTPISANQSVTINLKTVTWANSASSDSTGNNQQNVGSQQTSIPQDQTQIQQQQTIQQNLQQQQAALQQQIADKTAALQEQKQDLETKRQQIANKYEAKAQTYQALGSAVQNAANQIADYLQQQEQQKEAQEAQQQEEEQEQDIENQEKQLQDQIDQLQQQQQQPTDTANNGQYVNNVPNTADQEENSGWNYLNGIGVNQDYAQALYFFRQAAAQDDAGAQCNLGWMYLNGKGVAQDYGQAWNWFQESAAQGNAVSENDLGWMYQNGEGVAQDYGRALNWYEKAAAQGNIDGENNLGWMYLNGQGINQDYAQARDWFQKSAQQGDTKGKSWNFYADGLINKADNDLEGAIEDFYKAVEIQPDFSDANTQLEAELNAKAATFSSQDAANAPRTFDQLREAKRIAYQRQQNEIHRNFLQQFAGIWQPDSPKAKGQLKLFLTDSGTLNGSGAFFLKIRTCANDAVDIDRYSCAIGEVQIGLNDAATAMNAGQASIPMSGTFQHKHSHRDHYFQKDDDFIPFLFKLYLFPIFLPFNFLDMDRTSAAFDGQLTVSRDGTLSFAQADSVIVQLKKVSE